MPTTASHGARDAAWHATHNSPWPAARNVLCVRLDAMGDVLMTTPALRALRESAPSRRITLLTSRAGAEVAALVPEIDDLIVFGAPWMKATNQPHALDDFELVGRLRTERFDAAVIFTVFSQNPLPAAYLCYLAGIPLRLAHCRENPYHLLTDWIVESDTKNGLRHEVRRQLDLVETIGARTTDEHLALAVPEDARRAAVARLDRAGVDVTAPWVVIHPGASAPSRRWEPESFADAARSLFFEGWQIVFSGDEMERELVDGIRAAMSAPSISFAGELSLADLAATIEAAPLLISNNSGPVHIAAAVGTPVVDLYALTNPQHTPWLVPSRVLYHDVPCRNCFKSVCPEGHHNCLRLVPPREVVAAALELAGATLGTDRRLPVLA